MTLSTKGRLSALLLAAATGIAGYMKLSSDEEPHVPVKLAASAQSLSVMAFSQEANPQPVAAIAPEAEEDSIDEVDPAEAAREEREAAQRAFVQNFRAMERFKEFQSSPPGSKKLESLLSAFLSPGSEYLSAKMGLTEKDRQDLLRATAIETIAVLRKDAVRLASSGDYISEYRNQRSILEYMKYASMDEGGYLDQRRGELATQVDYASESYRTYDQILPLAQRQAIDYLRQTPRVTELDAPGAEAYLNAISMLDGSIKKAILESDVSYAQRLSTIGLTPTTAKALLDLGKPLYDKMSDKGFKDWEAREAEILKKFDAPQPG